MSKSYEDMETWLDRLMVRSRMGVVRAAAGRRMERRGGELCRVAPTIEERQADDPGYIPAEYDTHLDEVHCPIDVPEQPEYDEFLGERGRGFSWHLSDEEWRVIAAKGTRKGRARPKYREQTDE